MDNFDLRKYISNNPLLTEVVISTPSSFSPQDIEDLLMIADGYGEGTSDTILDEPMGEYRYLEDYEEEDDDYNKEKLAFKRILRKPPGTYVLADIWDSGFTAPGAPKNSFETRITINKTDQNIYIESPYISNDERYMGWFGKDRKYYPDTANFDKDGNYIGG